MQNNDFKSLSPSLSLSLSLARALSLTGWLARSLSLSLSPDMKAADKAALSAEFVTRVTLDGAYSSDTGFGKMYIDPYPFHLVRLICP